MVHTSLGQSHLGGVNGESSAVQGRDGGERRKRGEGSETAHGDRLWGCWDGIVEVDGRFGLGTGDLRRTGRVTLLSKLSALGGDSFAVIGGCCCCCWRMSQEEEEEEEKL